MKHSLAIELLENKIQELQQRIDVNLNWNDNCLQVLSEYKEIGQNSKTTSYGHLVIERNEKENRLIQNDIDNLYLSVSELLK